MSRRRTARTSKKIAACAGFIMEEADDVVSVLENAKSAIARAIILIKKSESVAASALRQKESK